MTPPLILASGSPYRLALLRDAGYEVTSIPSDMIEPELMAGPELELQLLNLAKAKAQGVLKQGLQGFILAADTVSVVGNRILGKPRDEGEAREMLTLLAGQHHEVWTAWALVRTDQSRWLNGVEKTHLVFRDWFPGELDEYLASGEWAGKCGAYGLRLPEDPLVTEIIGSLSNVIGLPLERLAELEREFPDFFTNRASLFQ